MKMSIRHLKLQHLSSFIPSTAIAVCFAAGLGIHSADAQLASMIEFESDKNSQADFQFLPGQSSVSLASMLQQADDSPTDRLSLESDDDSTLRDALRMLAEEDDLESPSTDEKPGEKESSEDDESGNVSDNARSIWETRRSSYSDGRFQLPAIKAVSIETSEIGNGAMPKGFRSSSPVPVTQLPESGLDRGLPWEWSTRHWAAANTFSHPLYFEDRMLERHGHQRYPYLQPFVSGGRFLAGSVLLPYLSAISPPSECQYTLGYYRSGNCVPTLKQRPPWQRKAAAAQATGVVSGVWVLP